MIIYRLDRPKKITGHTTINMLKADKIDFKIIKNISAENLLFNDGSIIIEGNLTLKNDFVVRDDIILSKTGKINDIDPSNNIVQFNKKYSGINFFF